MISCAPNLKDIYGDTSLPAGNDLLRLGSTELAMDAYAQSLRLHPTASACFNMGNVYFQLGAQLDARKHWLRAVELDPQCSADARVNLGASRVGVCKFDVCDIR